MISRIAEFDPTNKSLSKIMVLDHSLSAPEQKLLLDEFKYGKDKIDKSIANYRNVALVLKLKKLDEDFSDDWKMSMDKYFPKIENVTKLDNMFVSQNYDKILIITNRRLVSVDLKNLNNKLKKVNVDIEVSNKAMEQETPQEHEPRFMDKLKSIFS